MSQFVCGYRKGSLQATLTLHLLLCLLQDLSLTTHTPFILCFCLFPRKCDLSQQIKNTLQHQNFILCSYSAHQAKSLARDSPTSNERAGNKQALSSPVRNSIMGLGCASCWGFLGLWDRGTKPTRTWMCQLRGWVEHLASTATAYLIGIGLSSTLRRYSGEETGGLSRIVS